MLAYADAISHWYTRVCMPKQLHARLHRPRALFFLTEPKLTVIIGVILATGQYFVNMYGIRVGKSSRLRASYNGLLMVSCQS